MSQHPRHPVRIVTAASLFDGHDASINIMRRVLQEKGAEVIHLGHNRSVRDVVVSALQEGAQGIAVSSYQGGHMEYFKYMKDLLREAGADEVKIYGGGGGVIIHEEKSELENYGISQIFHPDDGRRLGLEGMIGEIIKGCDFSLVERSRGKTGKSPEPENPIPHHELGLALTALENGEDLKPFESALAHFKNKSGKAPLVLGITGTGGAGKSSLIDELLQRFLNAFPGIKIGVICVDPTKRKTGGALLGDRIRMNSLSRPGTFMRSVASRGSGNEISKALPSFLEYCKGLDFDLLIAESSGIGQASTAITEVSDFTLYVMTSEFGAQSQLEKIDMIDYADLIAINKADHRGSQDALRDVEKQYRRSRKLFDFKGELPVYLTQASNFNDQGVNHLFFGITDVLAGKCPRGEFWKLNDRQRKEHRGAEKQTLVPVERQNYLAEITSAVRKYKARTEEAAGWASKLGALNQLADALPAEDRSRLEKEYRGKLHGDEVALLDG
ncbi:MAG: cobalamin-dependent protein, partial [Bdellovibrionales bacterium]|nr:cobalamin-dependent protein [Bdellovibrionales bacterium]